MFCLTAWTQQTFKGRVVDAQTKEALPAVQVAWLTSDGQSQKTCLSDKDGYFRMNGVSIGRQSFRATAIGYQTLYLDNVMLIMGKETVLTIAMLEQIKNLKEVSVTYSRKQDKGETNNQMSVVSARTFNVEDTKRYAGSQNDPARMASNFAGVASGNDSSNEIVVRGNSPIGLLWQIEGINTPNPNHFGSILSTGGPISMLNNNNLDKSDFFTGAYPAQYGNAFASVFDLKLREGNYEKREYLGQIGFNGLEFGAEGPFSKRSKASYIANYRYSTLQVFKKLGINFGTGGSVPKYHDLNFKISAPSTNKQATWILWGLGGSSAIDLLGKDVDTTAANYYGDLHKDIYADYLTLVGGTAYEAHINKQLYLKLSLAISKARNSVRMDSLTNNANYLLIKGDFSNVKYMANIFGIYKFNAQSILNFGFNTDWLSLDYQNKQYVYVPTAYQRVHVKVKGRTALTQAFAQLKYRFTNELSINAGMHAQHFELNKQLVVEPRLGLKYIIKPGHVFSIGYGMYHQHQILYNYFVQDEQGNLNNRDLKFIRSQHGVLGYEFTQIKHTRLKLEAYAQLLDKVPVSILEGSYSVLNDGSQSQYERVNKTHLINSGTGYNYGLELTAERFLHKGFYYLITLSIFDSRYKGYDGIERQTAFNAKYAGNILLGKEIKINDKGGNVVLDLKFTTVGGKKLTPLDLKASKQTGAAIFDTKQAYSLQQPAYFRTDIKIAYRKELKRSTMESGIYWQNLTNHKNVFQQGYNADRQQITTQYQQGFLIVPYFKYVL